MVALATDAGVIGTNDADAPARPSAERQNPPRAAGAAMPPFFPRLHVYGMKNYRVHRKGGNRVILNFGRQNKLCFF